MMKKQKIGECRYCKSNQWLENGICERCREELGVEIDKDPLWFVLWLLAFIIGVAGTLLYAMFYVLKTLIGG